MVNCDVKGPPMEVSIPISNQNEKSAKTMKETTTEKQRPNKIKLSTENRNKNKNIITSDYKNEIPTTGTEKNMMAIVKLVPMEEVNT